MANSGRATNGSQFFLVYRDRRLDPAFTPFGRVTSGLDVVRKVPAAGTVAGDKPGLSVRISYDPCLRPDGFPFDGYGPRTPCHTA
jgi:cyclophilin family peptidyl-prolyl cis-trans isomerase